MKLALGTAQFGAVYGVANKDGKLTTETVRLIVRKARAAGISTIDTAPAYGDAQKVLGAVGLDGLRIVSKIRFPEDPSCDLDVATWVADSLRGSIRDMGIGHLDGVLLHRSDDLEGAHGVARWRALKEAVDRGLVTHIGYSVYDPQEIARLVPRFRPDIVQVPFNVLDRRFEAMGVLSKLEDLGVEVHGRSALLQGLLTMEGQAMPAYFARWAATLNDWHKWCRYRGVSPVEAALRFALSEKRIAKVVVGVDRPAQIDELIAIALKPHFEYDGPESFDTGLIDPRNWRLT